LYIQLSKGKDDKKRASQQIEISSLKIKAIQAVKASTYLHILVLINNHVLTYPPFFAWCIPPPAFVFLLFLVFFLLLIRSLDLMKEVKALGTFFPEEKKTQQKMTGLLILSSDS
jgi:hypothetical protein